MKRFLANCTLVVLSLAFCAGTCELLIRMFYSHVADYNTEMWRYAATLKMRTENPALPFEHRPNSHGTFYGVEIRTDSFGFRDRDYPLVAPPGRRRIVMLGDSFTLGWGVPLDSTYAKDLERKLSGAGQPTDVINLGVGNYNTAMEVALLREKGLQLKPDGIILMYFVNDAEPTPVASNRFVATVVAHSYLSAFLFDRYAKLKPAIDRSGDWRTYYGELYRSANPGLGATQHALMDLIELCEQRHIPLLVASIPELRELHEYPFPQATDFVRQIAAEHHVSFVDLLPALDTPQSLSLWVSPEDPHANARANDLIARSLYDAVEAWH